MLNVSALSLTNLCMNLKILFVPEYEGSNTGFEETKSGAAYIRPVLARIDQIAQTLAMDEPWEVLEIRSRLNKLKESEIKDVMKMRVDFLSDVVDSIDFQGTADLAT